MGDDLRAWIYTISLGLPALLIIGRNIFDLIQSKVRNESTSLTLFMGSILGTIAMLAAPDMTIKYLAIFPVFIDPGTSFAIYQILKNKSKNQLHY